MAAQVRKSTTRKATQKSTANKSTTRKVAPKVTSTQTARKSFADIAPQYHEDDFVAPRVEMPEWLLEALASTYQNGGYATVTIPSEDVKSFENLVRRAAGTIEGMGSRVHAKDNGDGTQTVAFKGQEKSNRPGRAGSAA